MPIQVRFRALTAKTPQIVPMLLMTALGKFQREWAQGILDEVQDYPPPVADSDYIRTYTLFNSWDIDGPNWTGGSFTTRITNRASYSGFVQGKQQTWFHEEHGWKRIEEFLNRDSYRRGVQGVINQHLRKLS